MCRSNQHAFCTLCIIGHLRNSSTCPECGEELTVRTLTEATRGLTDCLSQLNVKCDYFSRGCRDFVQLGDLQTHVMNCGFAPAQCSNQGCSAEVNERDRVDHEKEAKSNTKQDIIIAGGFDSKGFICSSVEVFSWDKGAWAQLTPMKEPRAEVMCFVYQNQFIVAGGNNKNVDATDSMEMLRTDQEPLQWATFPAKLHAQFSAHKTVVYQDRLIVIGGYNGSNHRFSDVIYEVLLVPPYSTEWLCRIPHPRMDHGAELFDDKILILGGRRGPHDKDATNSVILYDVSKNEGKQMPPLPYAVWGMSTVSWRNKVIVIGGKDKNDQILSDVVMYDIETGERKMLPKMKYKRFGCSAVVIGNDIVNDIVVMGGRNKEQRCLKSVECFSFVSNSWQDLPPMTEGRQWATAVV